MAEIPRSWQVRVFVCLLLGYFAYTAARRGVASAQTGMEQDLGFSRSDVGVLHSSFSSAYGISKFVGSVLADYMSSSTLFSAGLLLACGCNAVMATSKSVSLSALVWGMNGLVQGLGWPSLSKLVLAWYPKSQRGTVWAMCTVGGNAAKAFSPVILSVAAMHNWRYAFGAAGGIAGGCAVMCALLLRDRPSQVGLPDFEEEVKAASTSRSTLQLWRDVASSLDFWLVNAGNLLGYFVLQGVSDWLQRYIEEEKKMDSVSAAVIVFWAEMGGIVATFLSGVISDALRGNRNLTSLIFVSVVAPALMLLPLVPRAGEGADATVVLMASAVFFVVSAGVNGPKTMCGLEVREQNPAKGAGGAAGALLGLIGQFGASAAGYPIAVVQKEHGWPAVISLFITAGVGGQLCFAALFVRSRARRTRTKGD